MKSNHPLIHAAFDPKSFQKDVAAILPLLTRYLEDSHKGSPVLNWTPPSAMVERVKGLIERKTNPHDFAEEFLALTNHLHSPHYMGHQVPPPIPLAALFDLIASVVNQGAAVYEMGPFSIGVERTLVQKFVKKVGYPAGDGFLTHGGSAANLTAILSARNAQYPSAWSKGVEPKRKPAIITSPQSHYSVKRSAGIIGLGTDCVLPAPVDLRSRIDAERLGGYIDKSRQDGWDPFCIVASSCSTPIGAYDPLEAISSVCKEKGIWLHVDGAHGMSVLFSKKYRHLVAGVENSNSLVWDAHKMLYIPSLVTFLFFSDKRSSYQTFHQDAPYLLDAHTEQTAEFNGAYRTLECTKRAMAMGLGAVYSTYGEGLFEELVDKTYDLTRTFFHKLNETDDFKTLHEPESNILCFRYVPPSMEKASLQTLSEFQKAVRQSLVEAGDFYITATEIDGFTALRVTLINPFTEVCHLEALLNNIRQFSK